MENLALRCVNLFILSCPLRILTQMGCTSYICVQTSSHFAPSRNLEKHGSVLN